MGLYDIYLNNKPKEKNIKYEKINMDYFINNKEKILLVTGLSGGGKTTLTNQLCKKYNATHIELDNLFILNELDDDYKKNNEDVSIVCKYYNLHPELKTINFRTLEEADFKEIFIEYFFWLMKYLKKQNKRYIVEGIQIYQYIDFKDIELYPLIIINTGATKSLIQRWKRNDNGKIDIPDKIKNLDNTVNVCKWYMKNNKQLKQFVDELPYTESYKKIKRIEDLLNEAKKEEDFLKITSLCMKLNNIKTDNISEDLLIQDIINSNIDQLQDIDIFDNIFNLPYFTPEEMEYMGINERLYNNNFYKVSSDNKTLDENVSVKEWYEDYLLASKGIISENRNKYTSLWINKVNELCCELQKLKEDPNSNNEDILKKKQSILELGWNPEIPFIKQTRSKVTENTKLKFKSKYENINVIDMTKFKFNDDDFISESTNDQLYPIYVVITYTGTMFGKLIRKYTNSTYTHCTLSLDTRMDRMYTFNASVDGFNIEDLKNYTQDGMVAVYAIFITKQDMLRLKHNIDYYIASHRSTSYSIKTIFGLIRNKGVVYTNDMICSEFVDVMLKCIGVNLTKKNSGLVTPKDFNNISATNYYKVYEGKIKDYDKNKVEKAVKAINSKAIIKESVQILNESQYVDYINENYDNIGSLRYLNENTNVLSKKNQILFENYIQPVITSLNEVKEFPIQFDKDGNLLINKIKSINYNYEYSQSHKLLKIYEDNHNLDGIKYELSKLWFLNLLIEKKIYLKNDKDKELYKTRARILNDFNKYLKIITKQEKDFNFTEYYNNSPFSDATIKINSATIDHGGKLLLTIAKLFKI